MGEIQLPDGTVIKAFIFPGINGSLLSISQLVDNGFIVTYTHDKVLFIKGVELIFSGLRDPVSRLWMVDLALFARPIAPALPAHLSVHAAATVSASPAVRLRSKEEHVRYWHACFDFPAKAMFVQALKDFLTVPDLHADDVKKHLPNIVNTALGHLDATRKNIKSTRTKEPPAPDTSRPVIWISEKEITGRVHMDAAGALPFQGRCEANYFFIFFIYTRSNILFDCVNKIKTFNLGIAGSGSFPNSFWVFKIPLKDFNGLNWFPLWYCL